MENTPKHFWCKKDKHYFLTDDYISKDDIAFSICEICKEEIQEVPHYYGNIIKAQGKQTGPKTPKGKKRSSLNSYRHGMRSQQLHLLAPAITDRYAECSGCLQKEACKNDKDFKYCPVIVQPMMAFIKAYEDGNVSDLKNFAGFTHARIFQILQIILKEIIEKGTLQPKVISTRYKTAMIDGDGNPEEEVKEQVLEWQRNPLISQIEKLMMILGFHADQQNMTPAKIQNQSNTEGFLKSEQNKNESLIEFQKENAKKMEELREQIRGAVAERKNDKALNDFNNTKENEHKNSE